ncbi:unnamed protein product (macronuclear) [Paramecium tetraurelia]|uniref:Transmembrane protein n=1 Tax=Paramecium tetraurelia TaxID=5888 RepID=A0D087_PARTE|nr:uncharacterized protein GSPATT00012006001 [Paramecium tetraurelia]CAK76454.1 unnamed protein product [Paramecium tetraurelia]|eukprot:XP_001443851.1 hypothetical protein (macronuclear) [Paramecium tetraurelia strain d4-2]
MYLIIFYIITAHAEILQIIPNLINYQYPTMEQECENVELQQNTYFYPDINKEINGIFKQANSFQGLVNDQWNLTFINKIFQIQLVPDSYSILSSEYLNIKNKKYICTLHQNQENYNYQVSCKQAKPQKYIDNQPQFSEVFEYSFSIQHEEGLHCSNFKFQEDQIYIFCFINDQMIINTFDLTGYKQSYNFTISTKQCSSKFNILQEPIIIVTFYLCDEWEILIFDKHLNYLKRITNKEVNKEGEIDSYGQLQNFHTCYNTLYLIFSQVYFLIECSTFLVPRFSFKSLAQQNAITQLQLLMILSCSQYDFFVPRQNIIELIPKVRIQDIKKVAAFDSQIFFIQYSDHLLAIASREINQVINIKVKQIFAVYRDDNIFWIVDDTNQVHGFEINLFQKYMLYQQQGQYLGIYKVDNYNVQLIKCFIIFEHHDENDQLKVKMQNLKKQNHLIQIQNNYNDVQIDRFKFNLIRNINFQLYFPNSFSVQKESTENYISSQLKKLKVTGQFFLFKIKSQIYLLFNKKDNLVVTYNLNSSGFSSYSIKMDLNLIKTYYEVMDAKFALVHETYGKIYLFKSSQWRENTLSCEIHEFKEQIRISFQNRNLISLQLANSSETLFEDYNLNQFVSQPIHRFNIDETNIFKEHLQGATKVLNLQNFYIFQKESHLLIELGTTDTLVIQQKLLLLGGQLKRKIPPKLILLVMNKEMTAIHKYLIASQKFQKLSTFNFLDYIPIQPLYYQILGNIFIIVTQKQGKDLFHILLFNLDQQSNLEYYDIISTPYQYFYAFSGILYYYDHNQEIAYYNFQYITLFFDLKQINSITYQEQLQLDIYDKSEKDNKVYSDQLNIQVLNFQFNLQLINQSNPQIIMENNQAFLNPNKFVQGSFFNFKLKNTTYFTLQNPFKLAGKKQCLYFLNNLCLNEGNPFFIVQDLTKDYESNLSLPFSILKHDMRTVNAVGEGILIINQTDKNHLEIIYINNGSEQVILIEGVFLASTLQNQILQVQFLNFSNFYFINDQITFISSIQNIDDDQTVFLYRSIDSDKFCQILFGKYQVKIGCYQINSEGLIHNYQNYTIPTIDIYNKIELSHYLPKFNQSIQFSILNLSQTLEEELDIKIVINYKTALLFYLQIILKQKETNIKLNNIIRPSNFNILCQYFLIQNKFLHNCIHFQLILYDLQSGFQQLNPIGTLILENETFSQLNNTHIAVYNKMDKFVTIYRIDQWTLVKNDNINIEGEESVTFLVSSEVADLEFRVNVVNKKEREDEYHYRLIPIGILVINNFSILLFITICKKQKKR